MVRNGVFSVESSESSSHTHILKAKAKQENYRDRRAYTRELLRNEVELFEGTTTRYANRLANPFYIINTIEAFLSKACLGFSPKRGAILT